MFLLSFCFHGNKDGLKEVERNTGHHKAILQDRHLEIFYFCPRIPNLKLPKKYFFLCKIPGGLIFVFLNSYRHWHGTLQSHKLTIEWYLNLNYMRTFTVHLYLHAPTYKRRAQGASARSQGKWKLSTRLFIVAILHVEKYSDAKWNIKSGVSKLIYPPKCT